MATQFHDKMTDAQMADALTAHKKSLSRLEKISDAFLNIGLWSLGGALFAGIFAVLPVTVACLIAAAGALAAHVALDATVDGRSSDIAQLEAAKIQKSRGALAALPDNSTLGLSAGFSPAFRIAQDNALANTASVKPATPSRKPGATQ